VNSEGFAKLDHQTTPTNDARNVKRCKLHFSRLFVRFDFDLNTTRDRARAVTFGMLVDANEERALHAADVQSATLWCTWRQPIATA
jgi:hypothetical protein